MEIILDNVAIWTPKLEDELSVRTTPAGARIQKPGSNIIIPAEQTIYRYAKNYETEGEAKVKYCLFVRTYSDNTELVEQQLDAYAESLTASEVAAAIAGADMKHFHYANHFIETMEKEVSPSNLEIEIPDGGLIDGTVPAEASVAIDGEESAEEDAPAEAGQTETNEEKEDE